MSLMAKLGRYLNNGKSRDMMNITIEYVEQKYGTEATEISLMKRLHENRMAPLEMLILLGEYVLVVSDTRNTFMLTVAKGIAYLYLLATLVHSSTFLIGELFGAEKVEGRKTGILLLASVVTLFGLLLYLHHKGFMPGHNASLVLTAHSAILRSLVLLLHTIEGSASIWGLGLTILGSLMSVLSFQGGRYGCSVLCILGTALGSLLAPIFLPYRPRGIYTRDKAMRYKVLRLVAVYMAFQLPCMMILDRAATRMMSEAHLWVPGSFICRFLTGDK
jgi:hypothetical protein